MIMETRGLMYNPWFMKNKANSLCSDFRWIQRTWQGTWEEGLCQHQVATLPRKDGNSYCAQSGNLMSETLRHLGANGYRGILDPTQ